VAFSLPVEEVAISAEGISFLDSASVGLHGHGEAVKDVSRVEFVLWLVLLRFLVPIFTRLVDTGSRFVANFTELVTQVDVGGVLGVRSQEVVND
jgi:hypothetical protein